MDSAFNTDPIDTDSLHYAAIFEFAWRFAAVDMDPINTIETWMATMRAIQPEIVRHCLPFEQVRHMAITAAINIAAALSVTMKAPELYAIRLDQYNKTKKVLFAVSTRVTGRLFLELSNIMIVHGDTLLDSLPDLPIHMPTDIAPCGHAYSTTGIDLFGGPLCEACSQSLFA